MVKRLKAKMSAEAATLGAPDGGALPCLTPSKTTRIFWKNLQTTGDLLLERIREQLKQEERGDAHADVSQLLEFVEQTLCEAAAFLGEQRFANAKAKGASKKLDTALERCLNALERLGKKHRELFDTDVKEQMFDVLERGFVQASAEYELPATVGMFSPEANAKARDILGRFLKAVAPMAGKPGFDTPEARLLALEESDAQSRNDGLSFSDLFGSPA